MAIALFLQAIQALAGSPFVTDKLKRNEHVIRVLKQVGLDPEHPPEDFEGIYAYAIVEYGIEKPAICLEIFRSAEIRQGFRQCFDGNDPQGWLTQAGAYVRQEGLEARVVEAGGDVQRELVEFAAAFLKMAKRSQTPKEILEAQKLSRVDRNVKQIADQLEAIANHPALTGNGNAAIESGETLALATAGCRAGELALRMRSWFEVLGYRLEKTEKWETDYFEWVIEIPKRRGFDRVLVRGIAGEAGVRDVMGLRESVGAQRVDEGWLVTARRISKAARSEVEKAENGDLYCFTFDEFLDQDADFEGYLDWLEAEIATRGIEARYVPLACMKEEFDPVSHQRLGMSRYGEGDGWTEGYIDLWLDDPAKEHLSILGEFGTGKTWLALHYASIAVSKYRSAKANGVERPRLPIVIPLRDYAKAVSVESLFSEFFFRKHEIPIPGYSAFEELNRMGKLLLIFDGFDEMAARVDKQQMINNFWELAKVVVPGSKVILTCRTEHFPDAKEGRSLLNAELQASTRGLSGETPQFEVLELEKFDDAQIREVLLLASSSETVEQVMGNPQLLDLARRPVMTELILEALPDIEAGKPVDMSRVYLYAVKRKMERDIKAERTFTSMADKLYFLCELSWEMLSNDRMSLNYREFPDRIRTLFGSAVQEEKDLDHWHYDMMGQTMLIRNSDGDYTPAHRSLLEFFVAFKFAAELGALAPDFLELAQMKSGIDRSLEPRDYTWSEYFGGGAVAPLKGFVTEGLEVLRSGFGKEVLAKAVIDLLVSLLSPLEQSKENPLIQVIWTTKNQSKENVRYVGGNAISILSKNKTDFESQDFSKTVIVEGDFINARLINSNFSNAILSNCRFSTCLSSIFSLAFISAKNILATGDGNGAIRLWDTQKNQEKLVLKEHLDLIWSLDFSGDGNLIASASNDKRIIIWNIEEETSFSIQREFPTDSPMQSWNQFGSEFSSAYSVSVQSLYMTPFCVIFNNSNNSIISSWHNGDIVIWDSRDGSYLSILKGHTATVRSMQISKSNKILVSSSDDGHVRVWDLASGVCTKNFNYNSRRISHIALSPDNSMIAIDDYNNIKLIDIDGNIIGCLEGHRDWIYSIDFSYDGNFLVSGSKDNKVKIWNILSKQCISTLEGHTGTVHAVKFISESNDFASGSFDKSLRFWNMESVESAAIFQGNSTWIRSVFSYSQSSLIASGDDNGDIKIWDKNQKNKICIMPGHKQSVYSISITKDAMKMVSGSYDKTVRIWDLNNYTCCKVINVNSTVYSVDISADSNLFASAHHDMSIKIWTLSGQLVRDLRGHTGWIKSIQFSPDSLSIASCGSDRTVRVWDTHNGRCLSVLKSGSEPLLSVAFHSSGKILATGGYEGNIRIWDLDSETCISILKGSDNWIRCITFHPSLDVLVSGGNDSLIRIWDIKSGECVMMLEGHTSIIESIVFDQDAKQIISSGRDMSIRVWDFNSGKCVVVLTESFPYEGMNITGVKGLTPATIATLKALGAVENEE